MSDVVDTAGALDTDDQRTPAAAERPGTAPVEDGRPPAAVSVRGRPVRRAPLAWLPWAALGLAALLALMALLFVMNVADQGDDPGVDASDDPSGTASGAPEATGDAAAPPPASAATPAAGVTAGGQALLPLPEGGLGAFAGQTAEGRGARVESVVADEGFWVGDSAADRIFVFLSDQAKAAEGESPFQVRAGQSVDFTGVVKANPGNVTDLGVSRLEGADQLRQQGHYLELSRVALSG